MTYAYLGPAGTFSETAARRLQPAGPPPTPLVSVDAVLDAVGRDGCSGAVVPVENSTSGVVPATLGRLVALDDRLQIAAEVEVPVRFALVGRSDTATERVTRVHSHPHALAQCSRWTSQHLPHAVTVPSDSTAAAARDVLDAGPHEVAIASVDAAERYGATVLADDIGDVPDAWTRFVLVRPASDPPLPTGVDRTSLVLTPHDNTAGVLARILGELSTRGISVVSLHSWPDGGTLRRYRFVVDVDRHAHDPRLAAALLGIRNVCSVSVLGSFPVAVRTARPPLPVAV